MAATVTRTPSEIATKLSPVKAPTTRHGLKNYRCKRHASIPGWFDRWDFFQELRKHPQTISSIVDDSLKTACRRRIVQGVALHLTVVTGLVSLLVFVPTVADSLRQTALGSYQGHNERLCLVGGLVLELLGLKLVFDIPSLRALAFAAYTATIALLFASTTIAFHAPYAVLCLGLITCDWWLRSWLCGVRVRGSFLSPVAVSGVPLGLVSGVLIWLLATTSDANAQPTLGLGLVVELLHAILAAIEVSRLYDTIPMEEAPWGVYFLNLDLLAGAVFVSPLYISNALVTAATATVRSLWRTLVWLAWMPWSITECICLSSSIAVGIA